MLVQNTIYFLAALWERTPADVSRVRNARNIISDWSDELRTVSSPKSLSQAESIEDRARIVHRIMTGMLFTMYTVFGVWAIAGFVASLIPDPHQQIFKAIVVSGFIPWFISGASLSLAIKSKLLDRWARRAVSRAAAQEKPPARHLWLNPNIGDLASGVVIATLCLWFVATQSGI